MRKIFITVCSSVLFVGCSTPSDFVKEGPTSELQSTRQARQIAVCIARNSDEFYPGYSGRIRDSQSPNEQVEVVIRAGNNLFSIVQIAPTATGSKIKMFTRSWGAPFIKRDGLTVDEILTKGCL